MKQFAPRPHSQETAVWGGDSNLSEPMLPIIPRLCSLPASVTLFLLLLLVFPPLTG